MLTLRARQYLLSGLQNTPNSRLIFLHHGARVGEWEIDQGFPQFNNQDPANMDRGERVLTWRATLPPAYTLRDYATHVEVWSGEDCLFPAAALRFPFIKGEGIPGILYVNLYLE